MKIFLHIFFIIIFFIVKANGDINLNSSFKDGLKHWNTKGVISTINSTPEGKIVVIQSKSERLTIQQTVNTASHWEKYEIILEMKAQGNFTGEFYCVKPKPPWTMHYRRKIGKIDSNFKKYKFSVVPKPTKTIEKATFRIVFYGKGEIQIRSIRIIKRPIVSKKSASVSKITLGKNLLTGSSFELGDRYYTVGWSGFTRELGGYRHIPEYYQADNGNNSGRKYNFKDKVDGEQSLELRHDSYNLRTYLFSTPVVTGSTKDQPAIFSVYMKSLQGGANVELRILSGIFGEKQQIFKKNFKVDASWRRYSVNGKINRQGQGGIIFKNKGGILIDASMLEVTNNNKPSKYQPTQNFDCFVKSSVPFGVSFVDNPQILTLNCLNRQRLAGKLVGIIRFVDYWASTVKEFKIDLKDKIERQSYQLPEYGLPVGYYKISCKIMYNNKLMAYRENAITIVPNRDISKFEDNPFGFHSGPLSRNFHLLKMLGVSIVRAHVGMQTKWQIIEPRKGKFQDITNLLDVSSQNKLDLLGSLDYTPRWASMIKPSFPSLKKYKMPQDLWYWARIFPAENVKDMLNYVNHTVSKYTKYIKYWETWNEVHIIGQAEDRINKPIASGFIHLTLDELLSKSKQIYNTIKKINPDAVVVGQYACKAPYKQFDKIIKAGGLKYIDKLAVHFYQGLGKGTPPDENSIKGEASLRQQVAHWRQLMKDNGKVVGLWDTEFGICRIRTNYKHWKYLINWEGCTQQRTVAYIIKSYLVRMSLGIEKIFYYSLGRTAYVYSYNPFIEFDYRPQPGIAAFAVMTKLFTGAKFYSDLIDDKYYHIIKTRNKNGFVYALWMKSSNSHIEFKLRPGKSMTAFNVMGGKIIHSPIKITEEPIYIQSITPVDKLLVSAYRRKSFKQKGDTKSKYSQPDMINTVL